MATFLRAHRPICRSELVAQPQDDTSRAPPSRVPAAPSSRIVPRNFSLRSGSSSSPSAIPAAATAAAPSPSTPPMVDERKQVEQENEARGDGRFRVTQVDSAVAKDFYAAPVLSVADVAPGVRCITVEVEVSREFVPLDKAYTKPGQSVLVRLPSTPDHSDSQESQEAPEAQSVAVSSAPFSGDTNFGVLYKLRGDIPAGSTKAPQYSLSVKCPLDLHVAEGQTHLGHVYNVKHGDVLEVGQFDSSGMDLRPIMFLSRFPTLLIFAQGPGAGIATARALVEAEDVGSLYPGLRGDVRLFYAAPAPKELAYQSSFPTWERANVKVRPVVEKAADGWTGLVGGFAEAFEEDDLEYDPATTGAVVCGDEASNEAALRVIEEAGIPRSQVIVWQCMGH